MSLQKYRQEFSAMFWLITYRPSLYILEIAYTAEKPWPLTSDVINYIV